MNKPLTLADVITEMSAVISAGEVQSAYMRTAMHVHYLLERERLDEARSFLKQLLPVGEVGVGKYLKDWYQKIDFLAVEKGINNA